MCSSDLALRGMLVESWQYHPMGWFVLGLFAFTAAQSLFPRHWRAAVRRYIEARALLFNGIYLIFVSAFVSFGLIRALVAIAALWMR